MRRSLLLVAALAASLGFAAKLPCHADPSNITVVTAGADSAALVERGASRLERRTARIGLRTLDLPVRVIPPKVPRRADLCLNRARSGYPRPSSNSCSAAYGDCVWSGIDGVPWPGDFEWSSDYQHPAVPWYRVDFGKLVTLGEVRVWLRRGYPMRDFDVLWQDGAGAWHTAASVRGNRDDRRDFTFQPVKAQALRVDCLSGPDHQPTIRRIIELEAFGPRPPAPRTPSSFAYRLTAPSAAPLYLEVREVYQESDTLQTAGYTVQVNGQTVCRREHTCDGAGPTSYAVPMSVKPGSRVTVRFVDTSGHGLAIARVRLIGDPVGQARSRGLLEPFLVAPRIEVRAPFTQPEPEQALRAWIDAAGPARGFVQPGLLGIVGYANPDGDAVERKILAYAALAARCRVPWVLQLSSWWADTPLRVPDGLGGTFGDIRYQQIGYSRFDNYEDPGLKAFMESESPGSYSVHYGLTVPNLWSSTPWLTMNNARLNAFKAACLRRAMEAVRKVLARPDGRLLVAIVTDDEPIYWTRIVDWRAEGYARVNGGVTRFDLALDFNPAVVRAAAADGVRLDPTDGLSSTERLWLHENNARYEAMVCKTIREGLPAGSALRDRIYNYLLAQPLYPLDDYGHPGWEIGIVPNAAVGLEAGDEYYFERARDLGPLANSDFECARPSAATVDTWEPQFRAWHDVGCQFVQLCNPGPAANWVGLFRQMGRWNAGPRTVERALSALVQEAAIEEWRHAAWRARFVPPAKPSKESR